MREIKFRAWDNIRKEWNDDISSAIGRISKNIPERWSLCEFTGLKDKSGREIYEGDILRAGKCCVEVKWDQSGYWSTTGEVAPAYSEIIGNVHEHPDLLK